MKTVPDPYSVVSAVERVGLLLLRERYVEVNRRLLRQNVAIHAKMSVSIRARQIPLEVLLSRRAVGRTKPLEARAEFADRALSASLWARRMTLSIV